MGSRISTPVESSDPPNETLRIGDDLLIDILSRIPTTVPAVRCKLVCKRWRSLICSPYFISRFKQQRIEHESRYPKPLSGMLSSTVGRFNFRGFNLDYLPEKVVVLASCNDLILCKAEHEEPLKGDYYLCNPFTLQWIALPPPPPAQPPWRLCSFRSGLVCCEGGDRFRYRIVRFCLEYDTVNRQLRHQVEMYCSETGEWIRCGDELDRWYCWFESKIAAFNGKLHWVTRGGQRLVRYDPFDMTQTSLRLFNSASSDDLCGAHRSHVGEFQGVLRVMRLEPEEPHQVPMTFKGISVWELQEDEVILKEHIVCNENILSLGLTDRLKVVGFHPRNKDVVILEIKDFLASFNTKAREIKVETEFYPGHLDHRYAYTLQLPWWPTPVLNHCPTL